MNEHAAARRDIRMIPESQSKITNRKVDCIDERFLTPMLMYEVRNL